MRSDRTLLLYNRTRTFDTMIIERNEKNRQATLEFFFEYPKCDCGRKQCKHQRVVVLFDRDKIDFEELHSKKYLAQIDKFANNYVLN